MTADEKATDRRRYKRFRVPTNAYAFFGTHAAKLGQIIDVSLGGLSFTYIAGQERPYHSKQLDILLPGGAFYMDGIPFTTISDYQTEAISGEGFTRRCGVSFGPLTEEQQSELHYFIEYYATSTDRAQA